MSVQLILTKQGAINAQMNVDWGDGTPTERFAIANKTHIYAAEGDYHIQIWTDNNQLYGLGNGTSASAVVSTGKECVTRVYPSDYVVLKDYAFFQFRGLREVFLPLKGSTVGIPAYCFQECGVLLGVIIPRGYGGMIPNSFAYNASSASFLVIPPDITGVGASSLRFVNHCARIVLPTNVTQLGKNALQNAGCIELISDPLTFLDDNALDTNYPGIVINLANTVAIGNSVFTNNFAVRRMTDITFNVTTNTTLTGLMTWAQYIGPRITIRGNEGLALPAIGNIHSCTRLTIGANFTSIKGCINTASILEYVFEGGVPPTVSTTTYLAGTSYPNT